MPASDTTSDFRPALWLRNANVQSIFASLSVRRPAVRRRCAALLRSSQSMVLDCGDGVRLLGQFSPSSGAAREPASCRRLATIVHGWEGSSESMYVLSLGQYLLERGFDVFRLNLRDHGESHHLNRDIFHSCRLAEVRGAVRRLAAQFPDHRRSLVGFSLGGNFALRIGASLPDPAQDLSRIVAVSPVLDPSRTLLALENGAALYRRYFMAKWRRSLLKKQRAWPGQFDFGHLAGLRNLTRMTEDLVLNHTGYPTLAEYLQGYAITGNVLEQLRVRSRIIAAQDDPIIPSVDLPRLHPNPLLQVSLMRRGGHCGFRETLFGGLWLERFIHEELIRAD